MDRADAMMHMAGAFAGKGLHCTCHDRLQLPASRGQHSGKRQNKAGCAPRTRDQQEGVLMHAVAC